MAQPVTLEMQTFKQRLDTFERPQQLSKRRASSQTKKKQQQQTLEWPHEYPEPEQLARAGFFYKPTLDSPDNVQCFLCAVKLDGWEATDSPLQEHLAHSHSCPWATAQSVARQDGDREETRDPMSEDLALARLGTFAIGEGWAHEKKKGWKCKTARMVDAGWCLDLGTDTEDGVTCFYCSLSLDGWEPKDDPFEEHRRRSPDCPFFVLLERYADNAPVKTKGKGKGRGRPSNASRMSMQSVVSVVPSEPPSMDEMSQIPGDDDSIVTTGTVTSQAGGKKKKKAAAKPKAKGKKKAPSVETEPAEEIQYPRLGMDRELPEIGDEDEIRVSFHSFVQAEPEPAKPKRGRPKGSRNSKAADSSVMEIGQLEPAPKKATRGRKPKAQPEPESEPEVQVEPEVPEEVFRQPSSEIDLQLQEELDQSMDLPDAESTPQALTTKPKRGTKRTSDGLLKQEQDSSIVAGLDFPLPPAPAPTSKAKKGRKPKVTAAVESDIEAPSQEPVLVSQADKDVSMTSTGVEASQPAEMKKKKAPAKKGKGRKASSTRSSKATVIAEQEAAPEDEDLERDEREIEAELERIANEQRLAEAAALAQENAIAAEQDQLAEFEPSPSRPSSKHSKAAAHIHALELELQQEAEHISRPGQNMAEYVAHVAAPSPSADVASPNVVVFEDSPTPSSHHHQQSQRATPSPARSDKENEPSSALPAPPTTALKLQHSQQRHPQIYLSPTKTTRVPLAPSTPNASLHRSPARHLSPSKQMQHLASSVPWDSIDIEALLLASPQPTPGKLSESFAAAAAAAAGPLSAKERGMTVEQWVMHRAEMGEEKLRRACEGLVERFEREGVKGLEVLQGLGTVA